MEQLPHSQGSLIRSRHSARNRRRSDTPESVIEGNIAGFNPITRENIVVRPGGTTLTASSSGARVVTGQRAQITLGSGPFGTRLPASDVQAFRATATDVNGNTGTTELVTQEPEEIDTCNFDPSSFDIDGDNFNNPYLEADSVPPPDRPADPPEDPDEPLDDPPIDDPIQDTNIIRPPEAPFPGAPGYKCSSTGNCIRTTAAEYFNYDDCTAECRNETFNCIDGVCTRVEGTGGAYKTRKNCEDSGCEIPKYKCVDRDCELAPGGNFDTLADCYESNCIRGRRITRVDYGFASADETCSNPRIFFPGGGSNARYGPASFESTLNTSPSRTCTVDVTWFTDAAGTTQVTEAFSSVALNEDEGCSFFLCDIQVAG